MGSNDITIYDSSPTVFGSAPVDADNLPGFPPFTVGEYILDTYEVLDGPITGAGMGCVYRVRHKGWNIDLAMKLPRPDLFQTQVDKNRFIEECRTWINLSYHPNIVTCHYVRSIEGTPAVFSEWMEGGSLKEHIGNKAKGPLYTLMQGEPEAAPPVTVLGRILGLAIQAARGLAFAHEKGLIHRDVKPSNILLGNKHNVKIADFGLAVRRSLPSSGPAHGTLSYSSPEQWEGQAVTQQADIYSFGLVLLEMFLGGSLWQHGPVAGLALEDYLKQTVVEVPSRLKELLRACLHESPEKRPQGFEDIIQQLCLAFEEAGSPVKNMAYWINRHLNKELDAITADRLNNRALSFLDLNQEQDALSYWSMALALDVLNPPSLYNRAIYQLRRGEINDLTALNEVKNAYSANPGNKTAALLYAGLLTELCYFEQANDLLAQLNSSEADRMKEYIKGTEQNQCLLNELGNICDIQIHEESGLLLLGSSFSKKSSMLSIYSFDNKQAQIKQGDIYNELEYQHSFCLSPSGRFLAIDDGFLYAYRKYEPTLIKIIDLKNELCFHKLEAPCGDYGVTSFSDDESKLFVVSTFQSSLMKNPRFEPEMPGSELTVWDIESGKCTASYNLGREYADTSAFLPKGDIFMAVCEEGLNCYCANTGRLLRRLQTGCAAGRIIPFFSQDGYAAAVISPGNGLLPFIRIWRSDTWDLINVIELDAPNLFLSAALSLGGRYACLVDHNGYAYVWNTEKHKLAYTVNTTELPNVWLAACSQPGQNRFLAACFHNDGQLWSLPYPPEPSWECGYYLHPVMGVDEYMTQAEEFYALLEKAERCLDEKDIAGALKLMESMESIPVLYNTSARLLLNEKIGRYCRIKSLRAIRDINSKKYGEYPTYSAYSNNKRFGYQVCGSSDDDGNFKALVKIYEVKTEDLLYTLDISEAVHNGLINCYQRCDLSDDGRVFVWVDNCITGYDALYRNKPIVRKNVSLWHTQEGVCFDKYTEFNLSHTIYGVFLSSSTDSVIFLSRGGISKYSFSYPRGCKWVKPLPDLKISNAYLNFNRSRLLVLFSKIDEYPYSAALIDMESGEILNEFGEAANEQIHASFCPNENFAVSCAEESLSFWNLKTGDNVLRLDNFPLPELPIIFSTDSVYGKCSDGRIVWFDYVYEFPGFVCWDEGARPYLSYFLSQNLNYSREDFDRLISELQIRGFGYIEPEGIEEKLIEMKKNGDE